MSKNRRRLSFKHIGDNNRKGRHYYQIVKKDGKVIRTIKHRIDGSSMKPKLA